MRVLESAIMQHCCCNDFCGGILVVYEIYCLLLCCSLFIYGIDYFWLKPLIQWQRTGGQTLWQTHCCDPSHRTSNEYLCYITNVPYGDDGDFFDTWLHFAQMNGLWNGGVMHFAAQKIWYVYLFAPAIVYYTKTGRETWVWRLLARPSIQYGRFHSVPITAYSNTLSFHSADVLEKRRQATKFSLLSLSTLPWKMANDDLFSNGENAPFSIKYQKTSLNISSCPLFSPWKIKLSLLPCLVRFEKVKGDLQRWQLRNRTTKKSKTWQTYLVKHDFSPTAQLIFIVHSKSWEFFVGMFFYFSCFYFGCNSHNYQIWMCFSFHKHFFFAVGIHRMPRTMILKIYVEYPLGLLLYDTQCTR